MLIEDTIEINIATPKDPKIVLFVVSLIDEEKLEFQKLFSEYKINFTWFYVDMPRLDLTLFLHHLPLLSNAKTVKKKLQKMHLQNSLLVKVELNKLLDARFIR